ncbi:hypothetical protein HELRODRAFT_160032 [Helobdella robusta]|uniref:Uncharacterized protein n=1 Tax=Helobdella robusta TaxID=6412 RepID=T1EPP3_HELRO|nr:hypothetical protein HELRODRAFT_160032 [Helobdella robusta]ESO05934.1 hypothetical protein HELRODRAFT_160032 [Helobdella robusta]
MTSLKEMKSSSFKKLNPSPENPTNQPEKPSELEGSINSEWYVNSDWARNDEGPTNAEVSRARKPTNNYEERTPGSCHNKFKIQNGAKNHGERAKLIDKFSDKMTRQYLRVVIVFASFFFVSVLVDFASYNLWRINFVNFCNLFPGAWASISIYVYCFPIAGRIKNILIQTICLAFLVTASLQVELPFFASLTEFGLKLIEVGCQMLVKFLLFACIENYLTMYCRFDFVRV